MIGLLILPDKRTIYLKLGLESASKVRKHIRHCFLKSYGFHSLQGVFGLLILQRSHIKLEELISQKLIIILQG
jgi:hypothetical protein